MRCLLNVLLVCVLSVAVQGGEKLVIPEGIRYERASAEVNAKAKQALGKLFSAKAADEEILAALENKALICGPFLWRDIKKDKALAKLEDGNITFSIPVRDAEGNVTHVMKQAGKLLQSRDEVLAFWKAFSLRTDFTALKIRKLNPEELTLFWAMIPFDITEPLFILESRKHRILTVFRSPDKLKITWIDDYQTARPTEGKPPGPLGHD